MSHETVTIDDRSVDQFAIKRTLSYILPRNRYNYAENIPCSFVFSNYRVSRFQVFVEVILNCSVIKWIDGSWDFIVRHGSNLTVANNDANHKNVF